MADQILLAPSATDSMAMRFRQRLDDVTISIRLNFNTRARLWVMDIYAQDGAPIVQGLALVEGTDLWAPFRHDARLPPGQLFVVDTSGKHRDPGKDDLRSDIRIVYRSAADVAAAVGTAEEIH